MSLTNDLRLRKEGHLEEETTMETQPGNGHILTNHALMRMGERGIPTHAVEAALRHGRVYHVRGAEIYVIGRKDVLRHQRSGIDLAAYEGTQVVCVPDGGAVVTAYRNRDFRDLRPHGRRMEGARRRKRAIGVGV